MRHVTIAACGVFLAACMSWQTQPLEPQRLRVADSTETVRLILRDGDTVVVGSPLIVGDSLVGVRPHGEADRDSLERVSVPLASITEVQMRKPDHAANAAVGLLALVAGAAVYAASNPCMIMCSGH